MFKGSFVAIITPFINGRVDEKKLRDLVEWQIAQGTNGLVPVGTTGESPTLSHAEHARVIEIVVKAARKRVPVMAGAGSNATSEAISLSREAQRLGADAILSVNPYYNRPGQEGLKAHFGAVADSVKIPVILYNIPGRTGVNLLPSTIAQLARKHKNIIGVKEATGVLDQSSDIVQQLGKDFLVFSGDDSLTLPIISVGGCGVISVLANLIPNDVARFCAAALNGRYDEARAMHLKMFPLTKALFLETNPTMIKAAMKEAGLIRDSYLRPPLVDPSKDNRAKLVAAMRAYGIGKGGR